MDNKFNLIDEKWIPVSGKGRRSLKELFSERSHFKIVGNAVEKMAIKKFLFGISQRACSLPDRKAWEEAGTEGIRRACSDYLQSHYDDFWLYGNKPFLQMVGIRDDNEIPVDEIYFTSIPDLASGNDSIVRETQTCGEVSDAEKAVFLITLMNYSLGGKRTSRFSGGGKSAKPGPSMGNFVGYLHTFIEGRDIIESIWLNYFTDDELAEMGVLNGHQVTPPWEKMPEDEMNGEEIKQSVYSWYASVSRFVAFVGDGIKYTEGLQYPSSVKDGWMEPSMSVDFASKKCLYVDVTKKPWRVLPAILETAYSREGTGFVCGTIRAHWERAIRSVDEVSIWSGGLQVRANSGDQSVKQNDDFVESEVSFETKLMGEAFYPQLCSTMEGLDNLAKKLRACTIAYFKDLGSEDLGKKKADIASTLFWQAMEKRENELLEICYEDGNVFSENQDKFLNTCFMIARDVYDSVCCHKTARQYYAWQKNRPQVSTKKGGDKK